MGKNNGGFPVVEFSVGSPLLHRALPQLVWHRQNWSIVYPHVEMGGVEVELLKQQSNYIMGSTDPSIESHSHLYDLFVNSKWHNLFVTNELCNLFVNNTVCTYVLGGYNARNLVLSHCHSVIL